ncbi:MAG: M13 family metallopeptidase, partial [Gammaproteobacteria bacterium]|nr:M13 family metallopeptidase [Gammaproteobacteria bacterium]
MKQPSAIVFSLLLIAACSEEKVEPAGDRAGSAAEQEVVRTSGIDREGMNEDVRPQDDFYEYANGTWLANAEIPAEEVGWGSYMTLNKESLEQSRKIVVELAEGGSRKREDRQIGDYYNAWINESLAEDLGMKPLEGDLAEIEALSSHDEVAAHFGRVNPMGVGGPFNFYVGRDDRDSTRYVVFFMQTGLGLPDRDYYFDDSERGRHILSEYAKYLTTLLKLSGYGDSGGAAGRIIELETTLAEHQWSKVENRDAEKTYNPYSD